MPRTLRPLLTLFLVLCCLTYACLISGDFLPHDGLIAQSATPDHSALSTFGPALTASCSEHILFAAPRWWEDMVQWIRGLGWDRGRLVQMWLFFMLIGLWIIVRIKPRA
jgi:hypothetical protein